MSKHGDLLKYMRILEAQRAFEFSGDRVFELGLELGAGNGWQSEIIASHCKKLICTDLNWKLSSHSGQFPDLGLDNVEFDFCDALDLSKFQEGSFDLIFSSNMLQQIPDMMGVLRESGRVLSPRGLFICSVPNPTWRLTSAFLYSLRSLRPCRAQMPGTGIVKEAIDLRHSAWVKLFDEASYRLEAVIRMPYYASDSWLGPVKLGNALGLSSSNAYVLSKSE